MNEQEIITYLDDHLAGSIAAIELIEHLIKRHAGRPLESFLVELLDEIKQDQGQLRKLLGKAERKESWFRNLGAWFAEKFVRSKFRLAGDQMGELGLVQALEMLALGICGKQLLWRGLTTLNWPPLESLNLARLEQRAIQQQERVEKQRLEAVRAAFG